MKLICPMNARPQCTMCIECQRGGTWSDSIGMICVRYTGWALETLMFWYCEYHLEEQNKTWQNINIATGTTDPETDSVTWTKFSDYKAWPADSATWLQIGPPDGISCISSEFGHQMAKLALVTKLVTRSRHLHCTQCLGLPSQLLTKVWDGQTLGPKDRTPVTWVR